MPKIETALESENIVIEEYEAKLDETSDAKQEEEEFKIHTKIQRTSSRINPELIEKYNNPEALELEQEKLKQEKTCQIMQKKIQTVKLAPKDFTSGTERKFKYFKEVPEANRNKIKLELTASESTPIEETKTELPAENKEFKVDKTNEIEQNQATPLKLKVVSSESVDVPKLLPHKEESLIKVVQEFNNKKQEEDKDDDRSLISEVRASVSLDDFRVKQIIDKGSFGEVFLTENINDGKLYAMKRIKKAILKDRSLKESTENEKEILLNLNHPFLLTMTYLIENEKRYYFFLDYIEGGNLFKNMEKVKRFPEETVKFYSAQLALGLEYLHDNNLIHRDLKLENVLIDKEGYAKLCDFGLAKLLGCSNDITYTFCGTTEYLAPEVLNNTGHGMAVDWWTLGIITYEMCCGRTPFYHPNPMMISKQIKKGNIIFPDPVRHHISMSEEMKNFVLGLLKKEPTERLGYNSSSEIIDHPWFAGLDWKKLLKKEIKSPYLP